MLLDYYLLQFYQGLPNQVFIAISHSWFLNVFSSIIFSQLFLYQQKFIRTNAKQALLQYHIFIFQIESGTNILFQSKQSAQLQQYMSTRLTINIGFYFEKQHYAQLQGYIPRTEAIKIPELRVSDRQNNPHLHQVNEYKTAKQAKSQSKKQSQDQISQEEDMNVANEMDLQNENENEIDNEIDNEMQNEDENEIDREQQNQVDRALQQLEQQHYDSDSGSDQDDQDDQIDISSISGQSPLKGYNNNKTKRQKGETKDLIQLPDRRPRKDKKLDQASEIIRREQKERKRKQYLKKQVEAQQKATLEKILNETGRKLRMREEKEIQDQIQRQQKVYKTLGNVPKIITLITDQGKFIMTHKTSLFPAYMTCTHDVKMKEICSNCGNQSKYKLKQNNKFACSLPCYKIVSVK